MNATIVDDNKWITARCAKLKVFFFFFLILCFENSNIVQLFGPNLQRQTPLPLASGANLH